MKAGKKILKRLGLRDALLPPIIRDLDIENNHADVIRFFLHNYREKRQPMPGRVRNKFLEIQWLKSGLEAEVERQLDLHGDFVLEKTGKTKQIQRSEMLDICARTPCFPEHYYIFSFFDESIATKSHFYIFDFEMKQRIYYILRNRGFWGNRDRKKKGYINLTNKFKFSAWAESRSIEHPRAFGIFYSNRSNINIPDFDFIVKPNKGLKGNGIFIVRRKAGSFIINSGQNEYSEGEILSYIKRKTKENKRWYLIEELVTNHPDLRAVSCNALSTCRIISVINEAGVPECTNAMLRLAADEHSVIDNASAGGIAASVDLESGVIGVGRRISGNGDLREYTHRADNGAQIEGLTIPFFKEGLELVKRAHAELPERDLIVGWDIAFTESGPVVIEANRQPGLYALQQSSRIPLGASRFGELLAFHLRTVFEGK